MWIFTSNAAVSIVHKDCESDELLVRARVSGHIQALFPDANVTKSTHTDYLFRAVITRSAVAQMLSDQAMNLRYDNYKNSVKNNRFHDALARIWSVMAGLQPTRPYSGASSLKRFL